MQPTRQRRGAAARAEAPIPRDVSMAPLPRIRPTLTASSLIDCDRSQANVVSANLPTCTHSLVVERLGADATHRLGREGPMPLKIQGGTADNGQQRLCLTCRLATIVKGPSLSDEILACSALPSAPPSPFW